MDVTCQRCQTRYEFDDALVSSRGTTVKCTQCGHLFKVHAPKAEDSHDTWSVRTADGRSLTFRAMRELQAAITGGRVDRDDMLVARSGASRRLGEIDELDTFFPDGKNLEPDTQRRPKVGTTKLGVTAPVARPAQEDREGQPLPTRTGSTLRPTAGNPARETAPFDVGPPRPPRRRVPSIPPPLPEGEEPPESREPTTRRKRSEPPGPLPPPGDASRPSEGGDDHPTLRPPVPEPKPSSATGEAVLAMQLAVSAALAEDEVADADDAPSVGDELLAAGREPLLADEDTDDDASLELPAAVRVSDIPSGGSYPPADSSGSLSLPPLTPSPSVGRPSILGRTSAFTDPRFSTFESPTKQPSFARWLIGLVLLGVVAVVGFTLLKRYLPEGETTGGASHEDERVDKFLRDGRERLAAGDVEGAREQFIMASGVTDSDPRVTRSLALIEIVRADIAWLHLLLLPEEDPARERIQRELERAVDRADKAAERAQAQAPRDPNSIRLRINVLRLQGKRDEARSLVGKLGDPGPADALALASLDVSEDSPSWTSVIDRLQTATREERKLGRARALLVYALTRAGKTSSAASELDAFRAATPQHSLLEPLERFVENGADGDDGDPDGGVDEDEDAGADEDSDDGVPKDFREAIRKAHSARRSGNLDRAEQLYHAALEQSAGNSEALSGLAEVYRQRGDTAGAVKAYESLLRQNPGYLPALVGLADLKWQSGSRSDAVALYRQVIEAAPGSAHAERAERRINATKEPAPAPKPPPPPPPTAEPSSPPSVDTSDLPPGIDTSDLPDLQ